MRNLLPIVKANKKRVVLSILGGVVAAAGVVALLVSGKTWAMPLSAWQIAVCYALGILGGLAFALTGCFGKGGNGGDVAKAAAGNSDAVSS